ncbi:protein translocase subunit SecD [Hyphococcus luteus]|uniref:Protein translocase subunit SecD n=1 Tax=Hyphococcus luteus TaxID=2058213 RepID=A0A2S7K487_9PROT|nr:protein translocase subunit SecD [Marinicaulis flavus]PQA87317.1 protein translocase subunit SecD [Marinicaulis flavus]
MLQFSKFQTAGVALLVLLGALFAAPNLLSEETRNALPGFMPKGTINLGLDLQGGSHLLLSVDTKKVIDDRMRATMGDIRREMRPNRTANRDRISIESLSYDDEAGVISLLIADPAEAEEAEKRVRDLTRGGVGGALGLGMRSYTVTADGGRIEVEMTPEAQRFYSDEAVRDSIEVVRRRIDPAGNKEVLIAPQGVDRIVVQVPGDNDPEALKRLINRTGQLTFHRVDQTVSLADAAAGLLPPGRILVPFADLAGTGGPGLVLVEDPEITGDMVNTASASPNSDGGAFQINFQFDNRGARRFRDYTTNNVGAVFAIVLDNEIISAPTIQTPIPNGSGRITGDFTAQEAAQTALLIRSGALPAELETIEQRSVGAQLGQDSVEAGAKALIIGFAAVIIYMILSYGRFGVYADMALIANVILIAGLLSLMGSTLTLPGIAGIVLTIGMAVDANVLIFERIREEMLAGKPPIKAAEVGYDKARSAIIDANITTFLAALIMFQLGAGPVRGFAITLAVGVVTSVFTAYVLTRLFAGAYLLAKRPKELKL